MNWNFSSKQKIYLILYKIIHFIQLSKKNKAHSSLAFDEDYLNDKTTKEKLFDLTNQNEEKIPTIYKIIKGYLD